MTLRDGTYAYVAQIFDDDGSTTMLIEPALTIDANRDITADARDAKPITISVPFAGAQTDLLDAAAQNDTPLGPVVPIAFGSGTPVYIGATDPTVTAPYVRSMVTAQFASVEADDHLHETVDGGQVRFTTESTQGRYGLVGTAAEPARRAAETGLRVLPTQSVVRARLAGEGRGVVGYMARRAHRRPLVGPGARPGRQQQRRALYLVVRHGGQQVRDHIDPGATLVVAIDVVPRGPRPVRAG